MRSVRPRFFIFFMLLFMVLSIGANVKAEGNKDVEVKIEAGFNNNYKAGYFAPVTLNIKSMNKDIKGEVEIRVPSTPGKYISYTRTLNLEKGSEKTITIDVPVSGMRTKYQVLINNGSDTVYDDSITFDATSNNVTGFIGILSDDFDSLSYINTLPSQSGITLLTKDIKLSEKNFPENIFTLRAFDLIVINNFDTTKLSSKQYENLKQWVKDGGTLLIGTGTNYKKTLGIFTDDFIPGKADTLKTVTTSKIYELSSNGDTSKETSIDTVPLNIQGGVTILEDKGDNLAQVIRRGRGYAAVAAFDFGQAPFAGWSNNTAFAEKFIGLVNSNIVDINSIKGMGMTQIYYDIQNVVNQFSEMSPIKLSVFVIILLVYILMVAPINYIVLKKLDKRELMWLTVPLISLAFGLVVYVSGTGSRISKMTTNMVSIIHLDETGGSTVSTYAGIFSSSKSKLTVESKAGEKLMPISDGNIYSDPNQVIKNTELEAKVYDEGSGKIEYHNTSILQSKVLELQKSSVDAGTIKTELSASGTDITGKVSNNLNLDLEDCYIITPNDYYKLGDIKKGESITLGKKVTPSYFGGGINQMAMQIFNDKMQGQNGMYLNPNTSEYTEIMQKQSLVQMEFGMKAQIMQGMYFIGFSKSTTDNPLIVNGKETALHERTLVVMSVKPNFKSGDSINYPLGYVQSTVLQTGSLKSDGSGMLFGNGSAEVLYNLGPDMKAEEVSIDTNSNMYAKGLGTSYSIFNVKSNSYEVLKSEKLTIDAADLDKYLTAGNELKLKVELRDGSCAIPLAAAKGKVK